MAKVINAITARVTGLIEVAPPVDVDVLVDELAAVGLEYPHVAVCESQDSTTGLRGCSTLVAFLLS